MNPAMTTARASSLTVVAAGAAEVEDVVGVIAGTVVGAAVEGAVVVAADASGVVTGATDVAIGDVVDVGAGVADVAGGEWLGATGAGSAQAVAKRTRTMRKRRKVTQRR